MSSNEVVLGLTQLDSKISQDENMKNQIEKLNVSGVKISKNIMVVPVERTLLYIEQIYQTKTNDKEAENPLLKKVIVSSGNKVAIGDNLEEALENIVSQEATSIDTNTTEDIDGTIEAIIKANKNLTNSMNSKNWEIIGSDIKSLQELIDKLEVQKKKDDEQKKTNTINTINSTDNKAVN